MYRLFIFQNYRAGSRPFPLTTVVMGVHPVGVRARPLDPVITVWKAEEGAVVAVGVAVAAEIATAAATLVAAAAEIATAAVAAAEAGPAHPEPEVMEAITLVVMEAGPMWTGSIVKLFDSFHMKSSQLCITMSQASQAFEKK